MKDFLSKVFDLKQHGSSHHPTNSNSNSNKHQGGASRHLHQVDVVQTTDDAEAMDVDMALPTALPNLPEMMPSIPATTATTVTRTSKFLQRTLRPLQKIQTLLRSPPLGPSAARPVETNPVSPIMDSFPAPVSTFGSKKTGDKGEDPPSSSVNVWLPTGILPDTPTAWSFAGSRSQMEGIIQGAAAAAATTGTSGLPHSMDKNTLQAPLCSGSLSSSSVSSNTDNMRVVHVSSSRDACSAEAMDTLAFTQLLTNSMTSLPSQSPSSSTNDSTGSSNTSFGLSGPSTIATTVTTTSSRTTRRMASLQKEEDQKLRITRSAEATLSASTSASASTSSNSKVSHGVPPSSSSSSSSVDRFNKPLPMLPLSTRAKSGTTTKPRSEPAAGAPFPPIPPPTPNAAAIYFPPSMSALHQKRRKLKRHAQRVPRPKNCFMLYRSKILPAIMAEWGGLVNNRILSKIAAERWQSDEPDHVRRYYQLLARQGNEEHRRIHPDYKYTAPASSSSVSYAKGKKEKLWEEDDEEEASDRENDDTMDGDHAYMKEDEDEEDEDEESGYAFDRLDMDDDGDDDNDDEDLYKPGRGSSSSRLPARRRAAALRSATASCRRLLQSGSCQGLPASTVDKFRSRRRVSGAASPSSNRPKRRLGAPAPHTKTRRRTSTANAHPSAAATTLTTPSLLVTTPVSPSVQACFTSTADGDYFGGVPLIAPLSSLGLDSTAPSLTSSATLAATASTATAFASSSAPEANAADVASAATPCSTSTPFHYYLSSISPTGHLGALAFDNSSAVTLVDSQANMVQVWPCWDSAMALAASTTSFGNGSGMGNSGGGYMAFKNPAEDSQSDVKIMEAIATAAKPVLPMATTFPKTASMTTSVDPYTHPSGKKLLLAPAANTEWFHTPPTTAADPLQVLQAMYQLYNPSGQPHQTLLTAPYLAYQAHALMASPQPQPPPPPSMCFEPTSTWLTKPFGVFQQDHPSLQFQPPMHALFASHPLKPGNGITGGSGPPLLPHTNTRNSFDPSSYLDLVLAQPQPQPHHHPTALQTTNDDNAAMLFEPPPAVVGAPAMPAHLAEDLALIHEPSLPLLPPPQQLSPASPSSFSSSPFSLPSSLQRRGSVASTLTTLSTLSSASSLSSLSTSSSSSSASSTSSISSNLDKAAYLIPPPSTTESIFQSFASIGQPPPSSSDI
ncbi:hypothetical protein BGZ73_005787 [Actinomortierella ambigua]|nr:hypothetical protein BGZ73_005787 [Actinomortierella ambigua]